MLCYELVCGVEQIAFGNFASFTWKTDMPDGKIRCMNLSTEMWKYKISLSHPKGISSLSYRSFYNDYT